MDALELILDNPAPFLWLFAYLTLAGGLVVAVAVPVLRWFRGVIGSDDLAHDLYLDRPRTVRVELKADASQFIGGMTRAKQRSEELELALEDMKRVRTILETRLGRRREYVRDPESGRLVGRWVELEGPDHGR